MLVERCYNCCFGWGGKSALNIYIFSFIGKNEWRKDFPAKCQAIERTKCLKRCPCKRNSSSILYVETPAYQNIAPFSSCFWLTSFPSVSSLQNTPLLRAVQCQQVTKKKEKKEKKGCTPLFVTFKKRTAAHKHLNKFFPHFSFFLSFFSLKSPPTWLAKAPTSLRSTRTAIRLCTGPLTKVCKIKILVSLSLSLFLFLLAPVFELAFFKTPLFKISYFFLHSEFFCLSCTPSPHLRCCLFFLQAICH